MKTVQLTTAEIDTLIAAATNQLANLGRALNHADTVAARENIQWLEMVTQSAIAALERAK